MMAAPVKAPPAGTAPPPLRGRGITEAGPKLLIPAFALVAAVAAMPLVPGIPFYYLQVIILVFWFAVLGTSWSILGGYAGMHSIGHAAFVGLGAYISTLLYVDYGVSPWLGMLAGMAAAVVLAVVIGYPAFRFGIRGDYFALVTVALGLMAHEIFDSAADVTRGSQGIALPYEGNAPVNFQFEDRAVYYFIVMAMWLLVVAAAYWVRRSGFGFQLVALRDDEAAAARGGINVARQKLVSFAVSAAITAAAGTFYAQFFLFIDPDTVFGIELSVQIVLMAVLGGLNSYLGGTVGAIVLVPVSQVLAAQLAGYPGVDLAIYGVVLVLLMLYMPYGILGLLRKSPRWRRVIGW